VSARKAFDQALAELSAVRADPYAPGAAEALRRALAGRSNVLAATAAEIIGEWDLDGFTAALAGAFNRFLIDAGRSDPTCAAKTAIVEALNRLIYDDAELFARGLRHVQMEPVYGGRIDTAARLRAACALGLARSDPPDVLLELAGLLADPEADARAGAARAISVATRPGGAPLLWYKAQIGDSEMTVMGECFAALLRLEPERAVPLIAGRLQGENEILAETAALALGESRLPAALPPLLTAWENAGGPALRRTLITAIARHRSDEAFDFLCGLVAGAPAAEAEAALAALAIFRDDLRRRRVIERIARRRDDLSSPV
jgi:hypothetical protein